jgi:hypothetical protein
MRDAVNKPGLKEPKYLQPVLDTFAWALPHSFRQLSPPGGTSITLSIIGHTAGQWTIVWEKGEWGFFQGAPLDPDTRITLEEDIAWRLFTRGIGKDAARRLMTIKGDKNMAEPVIEMVSIIA